jgi:hypothetical protein
MLKKEEDESGNGDDEQGVLLFFSVCSSRQFDAEERTTECYAALR